MLCPKCGMQNNDTDNLCKYCGVELQNLQQNINNQTTNNFQTINDSYNQQSGNTNMQLNNDNLNNYSGTYKLTLTRPKSFVGSLWNLNVCVDGEKKCVLKNDETVIIDIAGGNHHISFSGYSDYTLQILGDATANVIITDTKKILLQDLINVNIVTDENQGYPKKISNISDFLLISSILLLIPALFFTQFMNNITILLLLIVIDIAFAGIGIIMAKKQQSKLGYSFKKIMATYIGTIFINIINIVISIVIKGF